MPTVKPAPPETPPHATVAEETQNEDKEMTRTRRALGIFLRQTKGFGLGIALYNDILARDEIIRSLAEELARDAIQLLILDLRQPSSHGPLLARVEELLGQRDTERQPVVIVTNLESCVEYNPELAIPGGPHIEFLATANLHRDRFSSSCPAPLVIWMTELLERAFASQAPDLWHWRSHVFDLRTRIRRESSLVSPDHRSLRSDDDRLHPETRIARLEEELAAYRKAGSRRDEMRVLNAIGLARLDCGDARLARNDFERVLTMAREQKDRFAESAALGNLGLAISHLGDVRKAIECHEQAMSIARELGDWRGEGGALGNLGNAHAELGDARKAIEFYQQWLVIARELGDRRGEGNALGNLGTAHFSLGDTRKAIEFYELRLVIAREIGDRRGEGNALGNLGLAHAELGDARKAIDFYEQALFISRGIGNRRGEGQDLGNLGNAYAELGDARKAIEFYEQQLVIAREIGDRSGEGTALWNSADEFWKMGHRAEAVARAEAALCLFEAIEDPDAAKVRAKLAEWRGDAATQGDDGLMD